MFTKGPVYDTKKRTLSWAMTNGWDGCWLCGGGAPYQVYSLTLQNPVTNGWILWHEYALRYDYEDEGAMCSDDNRVTG